MAAKKKPKKLAVPSPFPFDKERPLERVPTRPGKYLGESRAANKALRDYCHMGARRSIDKLLELYKTLQVANQSLIEIGQKPENPPPPTLSRHTLAGWSHHYEWVIRSEVYDAQEATRMERELLQRQIDIRERDYAQGQRLRDLADAILEAAPDFVHQRYQKGKGGDPDVVYKALDGHLLVKAAESGSKMTRLSAGMESDKKTVEFKGRDLDDFLDSLPDELLKLVADGKITEEELIEMVRRGVKEKGE